MARTPISTRRLTLAFLFCDRLAPPTPKAIVIRIHPTSFSNFLKFPLVEYQPTRRITSTENGSNHTSPAQHASTHCSREVQISTAASFAVRNTRLGASSHGKFLTLCNDHNQHSRHVHRTDRSRCILWPNIRIREGIGPGETLRHEANIARRTKLTSEMRF